MEFDSTPWTAAAYGQPLIPVAAVCVYWLGIAHVERGGRVPSVPYLRRILVMWNIGMALFSAWCTAVAVPLFLWGRNGLLNRGLVPSVCSNSGWFSRGAPGAVTVSFTASKFIELGDTLFLALRKRKLTHLHTFHHAATLLLTWKLFVTRSSTGIAFISMNALVHTVMYAYFAVMLFPGIGKVLRPYSYMITAIQIAQMLAGIFINLIAARVLIVGRSCEATPASVALAGVLYSIYLVLFVQFATERGKAKKI